MYTKKLGSTFFYSHKFNVAKSPYLSLCFIQHLAKDLLKLSRNKKSHKNFLAAPKLSSFQRNHLVVQQICIPLNLCEPVPPIQICCTPITNMQTELRYVHLYSWEKDTVFGAARNFFGPSYFVTVLKSVFENKSRPQNKIIWEINHTSQYYKKTGKDLLLFLFS